MRSLFLTFLAAGGLLGCAPRPLPPQVASSPVAYAYPMARGATTVPSLETPLPQPVLAGSPTARMEEPTAFKLVVEPIVVVTPSYRLPSDTDPVR